MTGGTQPHQRGFRFTRKAEHHARTLTAGSIAGMLFGVLFGVCVTIVQSTAGGADETGAWLAGGNSDLEWALALLPFAGIFFLWFIAVARERLGRFEDQFFSTVFLGSGLLFLSMMFAAAAIAGAIVASYTRAPGEFAGSGTYFYARDVVAQIFNVYALRMAAVFVFSQATLWLHTGVMPRWMAFLSYPVGLVLLFSVTQSIWVVLVFPAWVLLVSIYILVLSLRPHAPGEPDGMTEHVDRAGEQVAPAAGTEGGRVFGA